MSEPKAIDGSDGPLIVRRIVVWRRLEPGDVRTPGTEIAPESPHLEAKILEVGIARELFEDLERLEKRRQEVTAIASGWLTRYEPAGVLFATGGALAVGSWLDYLPDVLLPFAGSLALLGVAVGVMTRALKLKRDKDAEKSWRATKERDELAKIERRLAPRWERFSAKLREDTGFRADVRVGDIHEADRLVSIDPSRVAHPDTWKPDPKPTDVRYGWMYADGRVVEQRAELEEDEAAEQPAEKASREDDHAEDERAEGERDERPGSEASRDDDREDDDREDDDREDDDLEDDDREDDRDDARGGGDRDDAAADADDEDEEEPVAAKPRRAR